MMTRQNVEVHFERDFKYSINDNDPLFFGPYTDRLNGYFFNVTAIWGTKGGMCSSGGKWLRIAFNIYWGPTSGISR